MRPLKYIIRMTISAKPALYPLKIKLRMYVCTVRLYIQNIINKKRITIKPQNNKSSKIMGRFTVPSVWQWLLSDMLHYPPGCHRETIKTMKCMTKIMKNTTNLN